MPGPVLGAGLMKVKLMEKTVAQKITVLSGREVEVGKRGT